MFDFLYLASAVTFIVSLCGTLISTLLLLLKPTTVCSLLLIVSSLGQIYFKFESDFSLIALLYGIVTFGFCCASYRR